VSPILLAVAATLLATPTRAGALDMPGAELSLFWGTPFVGLLLSIALWPLLAPRFWHRHFGKVSAIWSLAFLLPCLVQFGWQTALYEVLHMVLEEYLPFVIVLSSLYVVAGGVRLTGNLTGSPTGNATILAAGAALASLMGTTGACMLLIRPLLQANAWRRHRTHVVIFFIFLVGNIGGALSPLGDPPLFVGFLKGVDFFWPAVNLAAPTAVLCLSLLGVFCVLDAWFHRREPSAAPTHAERGLRVDGWANALLLAAIVGTVLICGMWNPNVDVHVFHVRVELQNLVRDALLLLIAGISWRIAGTAARDEIGFSWAPMAEVAKLFVGIFMTIIPVIAMLEAGAKGPLHVTLDAVTQDDGDNHNLAYFWLTGLLSSVLDNVPTYLLFFNLAGGDATQLTGSLNDTLIAISAGAVFMGAVTYIGNAPNFMVKAVAEDRGVPMPSFFGYLVWSGPILLPLFALISWLFIA
jgi:Na+/H+ antiporter NhaD/arsenite permease-like protein